MKIFTDFTKFCRDRNLHLEYNLSNICGLLSASHANCFIAGGAIRRVFLGEKGVKSDVDVFFQTQDDFNKCKEYFTKPCNKAYFSLNKDGENNTSFKYKNSEGVETEIQLIKKIFPGGVEDLFDNFDFTICQFALCASNLDVLYYTEEALYDTLNKRLVINKITYPIASLRRIIKYSKQGFYACQGMLQKFLEVTREVDLSKNVEYID